MAKNMKLCNKQDLDRFSRDHPNVIIEKIERVDENTWAIYYSGTLGECVDGRDLLNG